MELLKSQMMVWSDQLKRDIYHNRKCIETANKICDYGSWDTNTANKIIMFFICDYGSFVYQNRKLL